MPAFSRRACNCTLGELFPAVKWLDWALVIGVAAVLIAAMAWAARLV